jgi:hypothetical protein
VCRGKKIQTDDPLPKCPAELKTAGLECLLVLLGFDFQRLGEFEGQTRFRWKDDVSFSREGRAAGASTGTNSSANGCTLPTASKPADECTEPGAAANCDCGSFAFTLVTKGRGRSGDVV